MHRGSVQQFSVLMLDLSATLLFNPKIWLGNCPTCVLVYTLCFYISTINNCIRIGSVAPLRENIISAYVWYTILYQSSIHSTELSGCCLTSWFIYSNVKYLFSNFMLVLAPAGMKQNILAKYGNQQGHLYYPTDFLQKLLQEAVMKI
jgi:hypothetical protein